MPTHDAPPPHPSATPSGTPTPSGAPRPTLGAGGDAAAAHEAVAALIDRLQGGLDSGDADRYDSSFAEDVVWGSPFGLVLTGHAPLNTIHRSQMTRPKPGHSRYEAVHVAAPAPGVVLAQVRRQTLDPRGTDGPDFSEMALYVLIERNGLWWLAAGQNTPIRPGPGTPSAA